MNLLSSGSKPIGALGLALATTSLPMFAHAYDLPPINLGFTSFLDGAPPAGNGWYFSQYVQQYHADKFKDNAGNTLGLPNPKVDVTVSLSQVLYISDIEVAGANLGMDVMVPVVSPHTSYSAASNAFPKAGDSGMGDLLVGPFLQWPTIMGEHGPKFMQRVELQVLLPTGDYSANREINAGTNTWAFNPYWSGTYFFTPEWTASVRTHYLWNGKNDDPNRGFQALGASSTRAGQAFHTNFAMEYAFTPQLRLGVNGYYLKQTTDTQMNGHDVTGRREQVLALGLGGMYSFSKQDHLMFNFYDEMVVKNRTEGERYNLRFVHHF